MIRQQTTRDDIEAGFNVNISINNANTATHNNSHNDAAVPLVSVPPPKNTQKQRPNISTRYNRVNSSEDIENDDSASSPSMRPGDNESNLFSKRVWRILCFSWRPPVSFSIDARILFAAIQSPTRLAVILGIVLVVVVIASVPRQQQLQQVVTEEGNLLTPFGFGDLHSGRFLPDLAVREWLPVSAVVDGSYLVTDSESGDLVIHHVDSSNTTILVDRSDLFIDQTPLHYTKYILSPTLKHVLLESNVEKGWRHSSFATYHVFNVEKRSLTQLTPPISTAFVQTPSSTQQQQQSSPNDKKKREPESPASPIVSKIALAIWSPTGGSIAYIQNNNIYVTSVSVDDVSSGASTVQITTDGDFNKRNGIADWVYEEEVLAGPTAIWWSLDGTKLAYIKFDDSQVESYKVQMFFSGSVGGGSGGGAGGGGDGGQYPEEISIKYPKAGTANPVAILHIADPRAPSATNRDIPVKFLPTESLFPDDDRIIAEFKWLESNSTATTDGDGNGNMAIVRMMNRVQDHQRLYLVRAVEKELVVNGTTAGGDGIEWIGMLVRDEKSRDGAWLMTNLQQIHILPSLIRKNSAPPPKQKTPIIEPSKAIATARYLELAEDESGTMQIAYYNDATAATPTAWLTKGDFEVTKIVHIDAIRGVVYYLCTEPGVHTQSMQRHLYRVGIEATVAIATSGKKKAASIVVGVGKVEKVTPPKGITWTSSVRSWVIEDEEFREGAGSGGTDEGIGKLIGEVGWYEASFSKGGGYYLVSYMGPDVPFQKIVAVDDSALVFPFRRNERVEENLKKYAMPRILYTTIPLKSVPGIELNAKIVVPNNFIAANKTKKYPLLISVYGGPNSQTVTTQYGNSFETALSSVGGYMIMYVDPRGTCCKGRGFRSAVSKQLGKVEADDVVEAAKYLIDKGYVDREKVAVWGWSYGGFLAGKVIEKNSGVINTGVSVAPVTDWKFYDSIYTERYMKTPLMNPKGYETSAVTDMAGFKNSEFLLIHGTGDDNVHFQNSLALIWKLTASHVHSYQVQFYPDSDHSMNAGNAFSELFELLHRFLDRRFGIGGGVDGTNKSRRDGMDKKIVEQKHGVVDGLNWDLYDQE